MARLVAFLRAINVGRRVVAMDRLRRVFTGLGYEDVSTFIASGNVVFTTGAKISATLTRKIEAELEQRLGFEVATFLRTDRDVIRVAGHQPFSQNLRDTHQTLTIGFLAEQPGAEKQRALQKLATPADHLQVDGRELYWLTRTRMSDSTLTYVSFEKVLGVTATFRGINTVRRLASRLEGGSE